MESLNELTEELAQLKARQTALTPATRQTVAELDWVEGQIIRVENDIARLSYGSEDRDDYDPDREYVWHFMR